MAYPRAVRPNYAAEVANCFVALLGAPALAVNNRYVVSTNMKNGAFTIANASPADGLTRNVTVTATQVGGVDDTPGKVTITGTDASGAVITEDIIPLNGSTVAGLKAFKTVTAAVQSGWTAGGTADTLVIGFGNKIGLPSAIRRPPAMGATTDVVLVLFNNAIVAKTVTYDAAVLSKCTVDASAGTYDGSKTLIVFIAR